MCVRACVFGCVCASVCGVCACVCACVYARVYVCVCVSVCVGRSCSLNSTFRSPAEQNDQNKKLLNYRYRFGEGGKAQTQNP